MKLEEAQLIERARSERIPVVWVQDREVDQDKGSAGWRLIPELTPAPVRRWSKRCKATPARTPNSKVCWRSSASGRLLVARGD